jgi:hypothetical protein
MKKTSLKYMQDRIMMCSIVKPSSSMVKTVEQALGRVSANASFKHKENGLAHMIEVRSHKVLYNVQQRHLLDSSFASSLNGNCKPVNDVRALVSSEGSR